MHPFKWLIYKSLQQLYNENSVKIFTYIVVKSHRHIGWVLIILITIMRKERNVLFNDALMASNTGKELLRQRERKPAVSSSWATRSQ